MNIQYLTPLNYTLKNDNFQTPVSSGYYSLKFFANEMDEKMVSHFHFHFSEHICIYSLVICKCTSIKCPLYYGVAYLFLINLKMLWYIRDMRALTVNSKQLFLPVYDSSFGFVYGLIS